MEPGDLVSDRFEIEAMAGAGGMGMVYRAIDRETGGRVALKVLGVSSPEALARFGREARLLADLKHPGIVGFVSHGETSAGERYLAMEWLDGEDLQERLSREGLRLGEAVGVVQRVAQALSVAHARGIVHRDVKPSNVFLVDRRVDRIKVLDFGIARQSTVLDTARNETSFGTSTGMLIGTLGYLAPEQALGAKDLGPQAEVFSLGCVLFRCVTGRQPFAADDPTAMLAKILFEDSPRASELRPDIPPSLDDLIARMLAKQPSGRPSGASEVARELSELHDLEDTEAVTSLSSPAFALGTGDQLVGHRAGGQLALLHTEVDGEGVPGHQRKRGLLGLDRVLARQAQADLRRVEQT